MLIYNNYNFFKEDDVMFVGRENELKTLEDLYKKNNYQMIVMYGRRRVGKTTLISKFIENKPSIFFSAQEANDKLNIELFSKKIFEFFNMKSSAYFDAWNDAFEFIADKAKSERFILVIDEFPYAAEENKSLRSIIQNIIDHKLKDTNIFIILCGSQISFMENEVLGYKSPLFGRRTSQMKVEGFNYLEAAYMLEGYDNEDMIKFYSCIGGTPHYLAQVDKEKNFEENLYKLYFNISGYLYDEPEMLLKQELREPAIYNSIITAIASGSTKLNEISTKIGEETSKVLKHLEVLINLRILYREFPFGYEGINSKRGIYRISDNCYNFWYRHVFLNRAAIEQGVGRVILNSILPELNNFIGNPFEKICLQYMIYKNNKGELPFVFTKSGRWWGNNPNTKSQEEIDLMFASFDGKSAIFAECKWRNEINDVSVLNKLIEKSLLFVNYENKFCYLFCKSNFSSKCKCLADEMGNVMLINLDDLFYN